MRARALLGLGNLAWQQADHAAAQALGEQCLATYRQLGDAAGSGRALNLLAMLGGVAGAQAQPLRAVRLFGGAQALLTFLGTDIEQAEREQYESDLAAARAQLDDCAWQRAREEGQAMTPEEAIAYALEEEGGTLRG